jgi:tRNA(fMet)-specific endonuclease VapC
MMPLYMLDTNVVSQMMREPMSTATQQIARLTAQEEGCNMAVSSVVLCELRFGLQRKPNARLERALQAIVPTLNVVALDADVAPHYASLRTALEQCGAPMSPNDTLIAAHALALDATLVSADGAFSRVPGLRLENWFDTPPPPLS